MFGIFSRKRRYDDLSWLKVDMHAHLLPGVDDGSSSLSESLQMIHILASLGIHQLYATPHIFTRLYPNDEESIRKAFLELQSVLGQGDLRLGYAAEYMVDQDFEEMLASTKPPLVCLPNRHVLIEMAYLEESRRINHNITRLQELGYTPILAHPERYVFYHQAPEQIKKLKDMGCLLQVNLLSMYGYYGLRERNMAEHLLNKGLVDLVGTDVRQERHARALAHYVHKQDLSGFFKHCPLKNESLFNIT